jgi:hypothetical protein
MCIDVKLHFTLRRKQSSEESISIQKIRRNTEKGKVYYEELHNTSALSVTITLYEETNSGQTEHEAK